MSSWQQALSEDIRKGKRREQCPVVMNRNQEKNIRTGREDADDDAWKCTCGTKNLGFYWRCEQCGKLRPDELATRHQMRARDCEIGRGGGYFQRASAADKKGWDSDEEEVDEFGRKKRKSSAAKKPPQSSGGGAASRSSAASAAGMSERQKAALDRLRQRKGGSRGGASRSRSRSGGR
mmetsp:Transcript_129929/g.363654  ORF Transcript_129929/g.363654 Transcript_129929/m.363654 type:complete len:178 (-) Transcript_129929:115-648(-)